MLALHRNQRSRDPVRWNRTGRRLPIRRGAQLHGQWRWHHHGQRDGADVGELVNLDFAANASNPHDADNSYNPWTAAFQKISDLNAANFGGYSDWRLPNIKELRSLVFFGASGPAIDSAFNNIGSNSRTRSSGTTWSSSSWPNLPFNAWAVSFNTGVSSLIPKTSDANNFCCFVRAVRGPLASMPPGAILKTGQTQCWDSAGTEIVCAGTGQDGEFQKGTAQSYADNGDGTITDRATGLVWERLGSFDSSRIPATRTMSTTTPIRGRRHSRR